jgi:hypothetical protein
VVTRANIFEQFNMIYPPGKPWLKNTFEQFNIRYPGMLFLREFFNNSLTEKSLIEVK